MPTVLASGPYRFFFYSADYDEPPHVHVKRETKTAKFWLDPVRLERSGSFGRRELDRIRRVVEHNQVYLLRRWNEYFVDWTEREARAQGLLVTEDSLVVELLDGRTISVPLAWYPRLLHGTPEERNRWQLIGNGEGIHWPDLDEDLSIHSLVLGKPSGESQASLRRWLEARKRQGKATGSYVGKIAAAADQGCEAGKRRKGRAK